MRLPGAGIPIHARDFVPEGRIIFFDDALLVHPKTLERIQAAYESDPPPGLRERLGGVLGSILDRLAWLLIARSLKRQARRRK